MSITREHYRTPQDGSMHPDDQLRRRATPQGVATALRMPDLPPRQDDVFAAQQVIGDEQERADIDRGYDAYEARPATTARRYAGTQPTLATTRTMIRVTHHPVPPRAHAGKQSAQSTSSAAPTRQTASSRRSTPKLLPGQRTRSHSAGQHPLAWVGTGALAFVVGGALVTQLVLPWWSGVQDAWRYGTPRTSQTDAVVGGGDSARLPTHFIATNVAGHPSVIEMHASDPTRTSVIVVPMTTDPRFPVLLTIKDVNHDHHPDLLVRVNGAQYAYLNDGQGGFRPLKYGEKIDM